VLGGQRYTEAKRELIECVGMKMTQGAGIELHNLGCAQWLHPSKFSSTPEIQNEEKRIAEIEACEAIPNFLKAIEMKEGLSEGFSIQSKERLRMKNTGISITNIAEVYLGKKEAAVIDK
jgi:hypothetical protein